MKKVKFISITIFAALLALLTACEPKPQPIEFGHDQCEYCRMMITEPEFASQALNHRGRSFKFDSVECMAAFDLTADDPDQIHSLWVPDFHSSENWLQSTEAVYLKSESLRSPMGLGLSAYSNKSAAREMQAGYGGEIISYEKVKEVVRDAWLTNGNGSMHMNHSH